MHDGTIGNKVLRIPEGGEIILPENTFNVKMTFDDMGSVNQFSLDLILAGETTLHYTDLVGGGYLDKTSPNAAIEKVVVVSSPVEYVGISSLVLRTSMDSLNYSKILHLRTLIPHPL